jgi:hypothetical protein
MMTSRPPDPRSPRADHSARHDQASTGFGVNLRCCEGCSAQPVAHNEMKEELAPKKIAARKSR